RDMSPPNVLLTKYVEVKIVDFGLAKANSQLEKSEPGIIKGRFSYLSPEAAQGQDVDHRTDIFAVGIILWELLTGQRLFLGETDFQTVKKVQQAVVPPVRQFNPKVSAELEQMVIRALAKDPAQRYPTARVFGKELVRFLVTQGDAVSTCATAGLVHGAMRERMRVRPQQHSIIDKLIEEALLEFTSLKEDQVGGAPRKEGGRGPSPLNLGEFEDATNWINELASGGERLNLSPQINDPFRSSLPPDLFTPGNLSALEDSGSMKSASPSAPPQQPDSGPRAMVPP